MVTSSAVGRHDIHGDHVVAGKTVLADQPAHAAAEGQAGNASRGDDAHRGGEPEGLRFTVELADGQAWFGANGAARRIDANAFHGGEIDHQAVVADGLAGNAVTAATHRYCQGVLIGEADAGHDVGSAGASRYECWVPIDDAVEDHSGGVVAWFAGCE